MPILDSIHTRTEKLLPPHLDGQVSIDRSAPLFQHLPQVTMALHLLYEDMKLDRVSSTATLKS